MKFTILLCSFFVGVNLTCAQALIEIDSINKLNSEGNKQGIWIEYLTSTLRKTNKKKAVFYRYTFYDNGKNIDKIGYEAESKKSEITGNEAGSKGQPNILNGTYKFFYPNGNLQMQLSFKNGLRTGKAFTYYKSGSESEIIDFENKFNGMEFTYFIRAFKNNNGKTGIEYGKGYWKKGSKGWMGYLEYQN